MNVARVVRSIMPLAELIVCETTSKWAVALRRQLRSSGNLRVGETRHLEDCWRQATASPASIVALEATAANIEPLLVSMTRYRTRLPRARVVVLADRCLTDGEWLLREAGAVHVVFSSRNLGPLVRLMRRHFDRLGVLQPVALTARWEHLPWGGGGGVQSGSRPAWLRE